MISLINLIILREPCMMIILVYVCVCMYVYVCVCVCVVTRIMLHGQASVLHPSGLSQMTVWTFLQQVGQDGLLTHVRGVRDIYR